MNLIIGYGQIGKAIKEVIGEADIIDESYPVPTGTYEVMHICFPFSHVFVKEVKQYLADYHPDHVIIYSTLPIGTTKQIPGVVHSPVEGKHPDLADSIRIMERWLGTESKSEAQFFTEYFQKKGLRVKAVGSSDYTEALKLLSTTEYGINIEFARYKAMVGESIGMSYELTKEWNIEYNRLYDDLGLGKTIQKFVLDAPDGPKGGHCVTPNAILLNEQYPSKLTEIVGEIE